MQEEILNFCIEKGILIDKEVLGIFQDANDAEIVKLIIDKIKTYTNQRMITKSTFENKEMVGKFFSGLPQESQTLKKLKIKFGLSIEISKEISSESDNRERFMFATKAVSLSPQLKKKIEVNDFTTYLRNRFVEMRGFLQEKKELENLVSINKLSNTRQSVSIIGMVYSKHTTKNKNIILEVEDLTGKIKVLINQNKPDLYEKADDIALDSVIGFKGFGSREIFFANDLFFPDILLPERKSSPIDESVAFISDIHIGSKLFFEKNFLRFIDYLNLKTNEAEEAKKIKYLFVVGDIVAGVGVYPGQEKELLIKDLEDQYKKAAELFGMIRKDIQVIMLPGNHDCVRLMEPQPILDEKYAKPMYQISNIIHTTNPSLVNIGEKADFPGFNVLAYHGYSYAYYANVVPSLMKGHTLNAPETIMAYLLKNRHLAPSHSSVQYYPSEVDPLVIRKIPDIFVSGHTHKGAATYYKNILIISSTCWEDLTAYQEKMGNKPDFCKVPVFNLKTRSIKFLDFYDGSSLKHDGEIPLIHNH